MRAHNTCKNDVSMLSYMEAYMKIFSIAILTALASLNLFGCSDETAIRKVLGNSSEAPLFVDLKPVSPTEIDVDFSAPVKPVSLHFDPVVEVKSASPGSTVKIELENPTTIGTDITADILVEDDKGNTLNVVAPFKARNDRIPKFTITELRSEGSKTRPDFIEIHTKTAGNLAAVQLFIASAGIKKSVYTFPAVEVNANETIILHMRKYAEFVCVDETGGNLALSKLAPETSATYANEVNDNVRELWAPVDKKLIHKSDVVYFVDQDNKVIDAVAYCYKADEKEAAKWKDNKDYAAALAFLGKQSAWLNLDGRQPTADGVVDCKLSSTKTLHRRGVTDTNSAADWALDSYTPGF
jgi:hypothetical protein